MNKIAGRHVFLDEVNECLDEHNLSSYFVEQGVMKKKGKYFCNRCGNNQSFLFAKFSCARCGNDCHYCRNCIMMGRVSECSKLISVEEEDRPKRLDIQLHWKGKLSKAQERASQKLIGAIQNRNPLLIWAVCGAGKTEILYKGIEKALQAGDYVCIATPRSDVVRELAPRLKQAFPNVDIAVLYGGSEDRGKFSPLTISTTHQLLRYRKAFDVMIIDEIDAFPYSVDPTLHFVVQKACKKKHALIYLTATPSSFIKRLFNSSEIIKIPARYHGYPLPLPTFQWCGNWRKCLKKRNLPEVVKNWVQKQIRQQRAAFLFVPEIEDLNNVVTCLKTIDVRIEGVHAEDLNRKEKVQQFRERKIPLIVTTTILERGVTVPGANVAVLGADHSIFTESALVQISGRVGRSINHPTGEILFFHHGKTNAMVAAKHHIEKMNLIAKKEGMLNV